MRLFIILLTIIAFEAHGKHHRVYTQQFASGTEQLSIPDGGIIALGIYLGVVHYSYISLTLESMRWNAPMVQFVLINVVENEEDASGLKELLKHKQVDNFHLEVVTCTKFSQIVAEKLQISVPFNKTWYYKMTDYKPTLAYLFPHLLDSPPPLGRRQRSPFAYWGYVDTDLIWGNFTRYAHLFTAGHTVVTSDYQGASGVAMFFKNTPSTREWFRQGDPLYTQLLAVHEDYQLDEFSRKGVHSNITMDNLIGKAMERNGSLTMNRGRHWKDKLWLEADGAMTWAGPVRWHQGSLRIVHASPEFPAFREILIFHRPTKEYDLRPLLGRKIAAEIEIDMINYGYLLPNWVPLLTRHMCLSAAAAWQPQSDAMDAYRPFARDCLGKHHAKESTA